MKGRHYFIIIIAFILVVLFVAEYFLAKYPAELPQEARKEVSEDGKRVLGSIKEEFGGN